MAENGSKVYLSELSSKSTMVTLKWDSNLKIESGGIFTGRILTEVESNLYVNKVLLDAN